jgi:WD40 repeat protein
MDILIACHCKETHKSLVIVNLKTLKPYRLMPVRPVDKWTGVEEDIKKGVVVELATPKILLDEFNIRSISYIENDYDYCKKQSDQFMNWDDIGDNSFDKIFTIYCDWGIDKTIKTGVIDRILRPNGDITIWGNRLNIPDFVTTATKIEDGDNFLLGSYGELSKSKNYHNPDDFIRYLNREDRYFNHTTNSFYFAPNINFTIQKRKSEVPNPVVPNPVVPNPVVPNPVVPNPVVPVVPNSVIPVFQLIKSNITSLSLTRDGKLIASAQDEGYEGDVVDKGTVKIWNAENGKLIKPLNEHTGNITSVAFNNDGSKLVSGSYDSTVKILNVETGEVEKTFECEGIVRSVAFNNDGTRIVSGNDGDVMSDDKPGKVIIWNVQTEKKEGGFQIEIEDLYLPRITQVAFNNAGTQVVIGLSNKMIIYYVDNNDYIELDTGGKGINSVAFNDNDTLIVSGGDNGVQIWDASKKVVRLIKTLDVITSSSVAFFGNLVVAGSFENNYLKIWNVDTGVLEQTFEGNGAVLSIAVNKNKGLIFSGGDDRKISVRKIEPPKKALSAIPEKSFSVPNNEGVPPLPPSLSTQGEPQRPLQVRYPLKPPSKNFDGTFAKPAGRQPKGYIWDMLNGFWGEKKGGTRKQNEKPKPKLKPRKEPKDEKPRKTANK